MVNLRSPAEASLGTKERSWSHSNLYSHEYTTDLLINSEETFIFVLCDINVLHRREIFGCNMGCSAISGHQIHPGNVRPLSDLEIKTMQDMWPAVNDNKELFGVFVYNR